MPTLAELLAARKSELLAELKSLDRVLAVLGQTPKRRMSAKGRAAIRAGQQRRWAKAKAAQKGQGAK